MEETSSGPRATRADLALAALGLRDRKRIRVKQMVQAEALRLFATKGYEQTTIDDIAHAAAMSPRTFFRYFPTKEDVVLWDEFDEIPFREMWSQPHPDDPLAALVVNARAVLAEIVGKDRELLLARIKLSFAVPEIRARFLDQQFNIIGPYYAELAQAFGVPADDLRLPVCLGALFGAMLVAVERWQRDDGREDLVELFDATVAILAGSVGDLRESLPAAGTGQPVERG